MTQYLIGATGTFSVHYDVNCSCGNQIFAIQSDMSRQWLLAHQRSAATGTSLRITIQFVLLLITIFHYDMICPAARNSFSFQYGFLHYYLICSDNNHLYALRYNLSCCWKQFFITIWFVTTAAKLVRKVG